jgi:hypothetical protein
MTTAAPWPSLRPPLAPVPRPRRRHLALPATIAALLAALLLAGCGGSGEPTLTKAEQDRLVDDIKAQIAILPHVARASASYRPAQTLASASVGVGVAVQPGQSFDPIVDEATRIVWTSRLTPVDAIGIRIFHEGAQDAQDLTIDFIVQKDALTAKYGPRPSTGGS